VDGLIGFIDDYLKLRAKKIAKQQGIPYKKGDKDGLAGWFKILGQVVLGVVVATVLLFNENTKVWREYTGTLKDSVIERTFDGKTKYFVEANEPITTSLCERA
jgi:phospho-N-acetylmuramoyl-pentapeptide-transferase